MAWKLAPSIRALIDSVNAAHPQRSKVSDGTVGDAAHSSRASDHNPDAAGFVKACDITHDPAHGVDCNVLAKEASWDYRTAYVIWNRRIWSADRTKEGWRPYAGSNPHDKHVHVSVTDRGRDDVTPWFRTIARPQPATGGSKVQEVVKRKGSPACFITDYIVRRYIDDGVELAFLEAKFGKAREIPSEVYDSIREVKA